MLGVEYTGARGETEWPEGDAMGSNVREGLGEGGSTGEA